MTENQHEDLTHDHLRRLTRKVRALRMYCVALTTLIAGEPAFNRVVPR